MLLSREQVIAAVRVVKLLDKMSDAGATLPEAAAYWAKARQLAGRIPNGAGVLAHFDRTRKGDGHDTAHSVGHGDH